MTTPNIQQFIDQAWASKDAEVAKAVQDLADYKAFVNYKIGPLGLYDWEVDYVRVLAKS